MHFIDLSHNIENGMPVFPGSPAVKISQFASVDKDGFAEKEVQILNHVGTHMDAPAHMISGGQHLDQMNINDFSGKAIVISFAHEDLEDLEQDDYLGQFESEIRDVDFVLLHTSWSKKWGEESYFSEYPALDEKGAKYLAGFRLKGVGIDAISIDMHNSQKYEAHHELLSNNMVIIENLRGLDQLRADHFHFFAFPLPLSNADGAPVRAVASYI